VIISLLLGLGIIVGQSHAQVCPPSMAGGNAPVGTPNVNPPASLSGLSSPASPAGNFNSAPFVSARSNAGYNPMGNYSMSFSPTGPTAQQIMQTTVAQRAAAVARNQQQFSKTQMSASRKQSIASTHANRALAIARAAESVGKSSTAVRYYQRAAKAGAGSEAQAGLDRLRSRRSYPYR
jgi:hypothetical protein